MNVEVLFGAATGIISLALLVLASAWKTLNEMIASLPEGKRKVVFNLKVITDRRYKNKAQLVLLQSFACVSIILCVTFALFSVLAITSTFLGFHLGFYQQQNFDVARISIFCSILLLFWGFCFIGLNYAFRLLALLSGKQDPLSTPLEELPMITEESVAKSDHFERNYMYAFLLFLFSFAVLIGWNYFSEWFDTIVALIIASIYFFVAMKMKKKKSMALMIIEQPLSPPVRSESENKTTK